MNGSLTGRIPALGSIYGYSRVVYNYIRRSIFSQHFPGREPAVARPPVRNTPQKHTPHHGQMKICNYLFFIKPIGIFYGHIWWWPQANARLRWLVFKTISWRELTAARAHINTSFYFQHFYYLVPVAGAPRCTANELP